MAGHASHLGAPDAQILYEGTPDLSSTEHDVQCIAVHLILKSDPDLDTKPWRSRTVDDERQRTQRFELQASDHAIDGDGTSRQASRREQTRAGCYESAVLGDAKQPEGAD